MTDYEWNYMTIVKAAIYVREELSSQFPVNDPGSDYYRFRGLCDKATVRLFEKLEEEYTSESLEVKGIHGELTHSTMIPSKFWPRQHTWGCITITNPISKEKYKYYVDITGEQFNELLEELTIPNIYISSFKPNYLLEDEKNPYIKSIYKWYEKIVDRWEYTIKGKVYDFIRWIRK